MSKITVNTDAVDAIAGNVDRLSQSMLDKLEPLTAAVERVQNSWEGSVSSMVVDVYNSTVRQSLDQQTAAVGNFVQFLRKRTVEGYTSVEQKNTSLADQFK